MAVNPFGISIPRLPASTCAGPRLPAAELARLGAAVDIVAEARSEAERLLAAAHQRLSDAEAEALAIAAQARAEAQAAVRTAVDEAVAGAVVWLVAERELERSVARSMAARLRRAVADWLESAGIAADLHAVMAQELAERLPGLAARGALTVTVAPSQYERVRALFAADDSAEIRTDATLAATEAWLDTPQLRLCFDLERQRCRVLEALRQEDSP